MSYMRGNYYLWADGEDRLHVWAFDGADHWQDSGRACDIDGNRHPDRANASGVSIPETIMDEYVMMRFAELIESGQAVDAIDRALRHGNFGGEALAARKTSLKEAISRMQARENSGGGSSERAG